MSTRDLARALVVFAALALAGGRPASGAAHEARTASPRLGTPVGPGEVARWSITVFPDGRGLPAGGGDARRGTELYAAQCAGCHGETATEGPAPRLAGSDGWLSLADPLRPLRIRKSPLLVSSLGARWPFATSVFDYVRRAMPHVAPKSLSDDDVYALTAFVLHANGLVGKDDRIDARTLPRVTMPARSLSARSLLPGRLAPRVSRRSTSCEP